jgi:putative sterol carrier protein
VAVKFLSEEWIDALNAALAASDGFKAASSGVDMSLVFDVSDCPTGDVTYSLTVADGSADATLGEVADPDVSISAKYQTAVGIARGELNTQAAFMTGKLKVSGNLAKLLMHQNVIAQWGAATEAMDVEY